MLARLGNKLHAFHADEDGIEAVQVVMIVAIAAVVLITLLKFGDFIFEMAKGKVDDLSGTEMSASFGGN